MQGGGRDKRKKKNPSKPGGGAEKTKSKTDKADEKKLRRLERAAEVRSFAALACAAATLIFTDPRLGYQALEDKAHTARVLVQASSRPAAGIQAGLNASLVSSRVRV